MKASHAHVLIRGRAFFYLILIPEKLVNDLPIRGTMGTILRIFIKKCDIST